MQVGNCRAQGNPIFHGTLLDTPFPTPPHTRGAGGRGTCHHPQKCDRPTCQKSERFS